jgi:hypothetical protein
MVAALRHENIRTINDQCRLVPAAVGWATLAARKESK